MRFHRESKRDAYDAIVVGAGIGGLTAASLLARAGRRVLVVERHDRTGGYAHSFRRSRYLFDSAVHMVGGCGPSGREGEGLLFRLLDTLGAGDRCVFRPIDPCYTAYYPDLRISAPTGLEEFVRAHLAEFPREEKGLRQLVQDCVNIRTEISAAGDLASPFDVMRHPTRFPTLLPYRRATLADAMDAHLSDPQLKALFGTLWPYLGLPPSRVSFLYWATMLLSYVQDGTYYCRGSFQSFANALADAVEERGGEVLLRSPVRRIRVEGGEVRGITLENGQRIEAPLVISNADLTQTVEELVGTSAFPRRFVRTLQRLTPSVSAFVVYAATDLDLTHFDASHESFLYRTWDHDESYRAVLAGEPSWVTATIPTLSDPTLAPRGEHLMILTTLVPTTPTRHWGDEKERFTQAMLRAADERFPGLTSRLTFAEGATPRTMERYTRNTDGAIYGWAVSPGQVGPGRPANRTPIRGLLLAGHWTQPGGGVYGVVTSGVGAAREALGFTRDAELWKALAEA
ncbi:MAG: NAD(P)/FAD-dependent oxidoreductase [Proteobacteria bacterium]|nr:NAD(P)/FAD-dependent oxidoreductase [Pseudomonadota bacterium]